MYAFFVRLKKFKQLDIDCMNPILRKGGVAHMAPYHSDPFFAESHGKGGSKYTQNLSFLITNYLKLLSSQIFSKARERPPKLGG